MEFHQEMNADEAMIISEQQLRIIAKNLKRSSSARPDEGVSQKYINRSPSIPSDDVLSIRQLQTTLQAVIKTAGAVRLSESHAAAACDTLRGCLSQCEASENASLRALAYSQKTWLDIFNIFLGTSESRKPKPLKLLLVALERNLVKNPSKAVRDALVSHVTWRTWQTICQENGADNAVKPAILVLRHFMSKSIIRIQDVVLTVSQESAVKDSGEIDFVHRLGASSSLDSSSMSRCMKYSHDFLRRIFHWVRYPDVAASIGRLIAIFSTSWRTWSSSWTDSRSLEATNCGSEPIWLSALKSSMKTQPDLLDLFATHIFPEIVSQDREGTADFAQAFPLENLRSGSNMAHDFAELHITLLFLRSVKEKPSFGAVDDQTIENIATGLVCHVNPQIRSIAFSLVTRSSSSREPFTEKMLSVLPLILPFYHAEVDPKARQDNVAMIKRLCLRLAGALKHLTRSQPDSWSRKADPGRNPDALDSQTPNDSELGVALYDQHLAFLLWYWDFIVQELRPTASYQRHITSLKVFEFLMANEINVMQILGDNRNAESQQTGACKVSCDELLTSLMNLVLDPFDDVRELAASNLRSMPASAWSNWMRGVHDTSYSLSDQAISLSKSLGHSNGSTLAYDAGLSLALQRATEKMQNTARADHADGFGRLCELFLGHGTAIDQEETQREQDQLLLSHLMSALEDCIETARKSIHAAANTTSLHGLLIATRYSILRYNNSSLPNGQNVKRSPIWRDISDRLLNIAYNVWIAVKDILCADAPEGHELEKSEDQASVDTKDMLSFCWRALKESSTLIRSLIAGSKPRSITRVFQHRHYREFGDLAFTQLAELRHRGAFSTVSQTFAECCVRCVQSEDPETRALPQGWYQKTLLCIQQRASALTRRSAGLPAMITGILSATPGDTFFNTVVQDLQAIADTTADLNSTDERVQLPQVHAFNCLKDVFTDARFNASVDQHMSSSLEIAVRGLESHRWAIRNCGLMLLKALITRLNDGTNTLSSKAPSSHRRLSSLVYDKYQNLPDLLLRLLTQTDATNSEGSLHGVALADKLVLRAQRVFPALEMIEQSGIPRRHHQEIRQAVWNHLEGPVWAIREKAAKALSYLPSSEAIETEIGRCLQTPWSTQNHLHGRLLYLRYLVSRLDSSLIGLNTALDNVLYGFQILITENCCPITRSSFTALVADILEAISKDQLPSDLPPTAEKNGPNVRTSVELRSRLISDNWRDFAEYLQQPCSAQPANALEAAAKGRCRSLVKSVDDSIERRYGQIAISHTILVDLQSHGLPQNPAEADRMLTDTGRSLAFLSRGNEQLAGVNSSRVGSWSRALRLAQNEHAEISTRRAAIDSLTAYLDIPQDTPSETKPLSEMVDLLLILHDSLLDDDEDVRDTGAATVSKLLSSAASKDDSETIRIPLMVPAARHHLLGLLKKRSRNSAILWTEAVQRILGMRSSQLLTKSPEQAPRRPLFTSPRALLERLKPDDTSLFVEERQNLYIDEVQEAGVWLDVLLSLHPRAVDLGILRQLHRWAAEGTDALIEAAERETDGPLGWTSKPEVFTLGVRIIHAAEASICLAEHESLGVDGSGVLRSRLEKLLAVGEESSLNAAWLRMIRKALKIERWF